jgi:hypothetical protein
MNYLNILSLVAGKRTEQDIREIEFHFWKRQIMRESYIKFLMVNFSEGWNGKSSTDALDGLPDMYKNHHHHRRCRSFSPTAYIIHT